MLLHGIKCVFLYRQSGVSKWRIWDGGAILAKETIQTIAVLYSKAIDTKTNVCVHCDNYHVWTILSHISISNFFISTYIDERLLQYVQKVSTVNIGIP